MCLPCVCYFALRVGGLLVFVSVIRTVLNLFHLTLRMDLSSHSPRSPWPRHLCPSLCLARSILAPSPLSLSPCLIGTGLFSQWRCVQIQLVYVMLCCLVLLSNGHSGQESSWTHTHARGKRLTIHSLHYHIACLSERTGPGCAVVLPWSAIQAPWNSFHCDDQWHVSISIKPENATGLKV